MSSYWTAWFLGIIEMLTSIPTSLMPWTRVSEVKQEDDSRNATNNDLPPASSGSKVSGLVRQIEWLVSAGFTVVEHIASTAQAAGTFVETIQIWSLFSKAGLASGGLMVVCLGASVAAISVAIVNIVRSVLNAASRLLVCTLLALSGLTQSIGPFMFSTINSKLLHAQQTVTVQGYNTLAHQGCITVPHLLYAQVRSVVCTGWRVTKALIMVLPPVIIIMSGYRAGSRLLMCGSAVLKEVVAVTLHHPQQALLRGPASLGKMLVPEALITFAQALFTEECSLVDAFVFFAYTTSPVFMLSLLQWCGMDVKQRAGKTQASIKRKRVKKVVHDETSSVRAPLEDQGVPSNASAPTAGTTPAKAPASKPPVDDFNRQQQTTAKKPMQDLDSPGSQRGVDVNVTAGPAEQVSNELLADGVTEDSLRTHSKEEESGQAATGVPADESVNFLASFAEAFASYAAGAHAAEELQQTSIFSDEARNGDALPEQTAGIGNAGIDDIIADGDWVPCPFQDEQHMYRQPKQGSFLGKGNFATVYWVEKVSKASLGEVERVAVKEVRPAAGEALDKVTLDEVQQEAKIAQDPALAVMDSVPVCHGFFPPQEDQLGAPAYLVMGLAKGKTVQEILDKVHKQALLRTGEKLDALKSWAWQFGIRVALFMFKELTAIHATGYRHRDIKPEQVIVDGYDGQVLTGTIVDWACGRHQSQHEPTSTAYTLSFCPPELLKSKLGESQVVDDRLRDAFSLGVMLHYIFTCCNPDWQPAFDPPAKKLKALRRDRSTDPVVRRRALQTAVADQHASWAEAHSAIDRADGLEPFRAPQASPVLAAIQQAAEFTGKRHSPQEEAAKVSQLLHRLLDPVSTGKHLERRWFIDRLNFAHLPWRHCLRDKRMHRCPVGALRHGT